MTGYRVSVSRLLGLPGVWRLEQRGIYSVNSWFVSGRSGAYLIDSGLPRRSNELVSLVRWLLAGQRLDGILLTHGHRDHLGAAYELAQELGAPVYAHPGEIPYIAGQQGYSAIPGARWTYRLTMALDRLGEQAGQRLRAGLAGLRGQRQPPPPAGELPLEPVEDGQQVGPFTVLHTPGHTPGHVCYLHPVLGALFSGDLFMRVLPWATGPLWCSTLDVRANRLQQRRVREIGAAQWILPGHGRPFRVPPARPARKRKQGVAGRD